MEYKFVFQINERILRHLKMAEKLRILDREKLLAPDSLGYMSVDKKPLLW